MSSIPFFFLFPPSSPSFYVTRAERQRGSWYEKPKKKKRKKLTIFCTGRSVGRSLPFGRFFPNLSPSLGAIKRLPYCLFLIKMCVCFSSFFSTLFRPGVQLNILKNKQIKRLLILAITGERVLRVRERNKLRALEPTDVHINRREGREYRKLTRREWRWDVAIIPYLHSCRAERTKSAPERTHVQLFRWWKYSKRGEEEEEESFAFTDGDESPPTVRKRWAATLDMWKIRFEAGPHDLHRLAGEEKKKRKRKIVNMDDEPTATERERESGIKWKLSLSLLVYTIPNRHFLHLLQDPYLNMQTRNTE